LGFAEYGWALKSLKSVLRAQEEMAISSVQLEDLVVATKVIAIRGDVLCVAARGCTTSAIDKDPQPLGQKLP